MATNVPVTLDTLITIKVSIQGSNRKFKIPLRDLGANVLPAKLRFLLSIPQNQQVVFERFSDSAGAYITLDPENPQVYKTLFRAAKAKLKLRLRATVQSDLSEIPEDTPSAAPPAPQLAEASSSSSSITPPANPPPPSNRHSIAGVPTPQAPTTIRSYGLTPAIAAQWSRGRLDHAASMSDLKSNLEKRKTIHNVASVADIKKEAPVPQPFLGRGQFFTDLANISRERERDLAFRMREPKAPSAPQPPCAWSIYCNACDKPMSNEHYHCSICDDNDYDLCKACVDAGVHCPGEGHWLVKRFVQNGQVVCSTTERIAPKPKTPVKAELEAEKEMPGAFTDEKKIILEEPEVEAEVPTRTCNSCVKVFPESEFVTCTTCDDYDLCIPCHVSTKHGHHPAHAFKPATEDTSIGPLAEFLCAAGRNVRHAAVCDGCDKFIYGIRHKCLNCPDWDYCSECVKNVKYIHPQHRFAPIYDPLPEPRNYAVRHFGIFCDGPLCKGKPSQSYIEGVRYKCAVCHDLDFCANCEANPGNRHNRTHPLIKFKTPVRNVSVTTMGEDKNGNAMTAMGDQPQPASPSAATGFSVSNAATQVQTIADLKPSEQSPPRPAKEKIEIKDLLSEPVQEKIKVEDLLTTPVPESSKMAEPVKAEQPSSPKPEPASKPVPSSKLNAHFVRDTVQDGSPVLPNQRFIQVWTLRNPGPHAWPAGCSVRYTGGDNMLNVDHSHPSTATDIAEATESNVVGRPVEVNEEISFRVMMKAPKREGTAISYWRLKAADGAPFGHRLWCHIDVTTKGFQSAMPLATSPPPSYGPSPVAPNLFAMGSTIPAIAPSPLTDYQQQLTLLEQMNKRRLLKKRRDEEEAEKARQADAEKEQKAKAEQDAANSRREILRMQMQQEHDERKEQLRRLVRQQVQAQYLAQKAKATAQAGPSRSTLVPIPVSGPEPAVKSEEKQAAPSVEKEVVEPQPISLPELQPTAEDVSSIKSEAGDSVVAKAESVSEPEIKQEQMQGSDMIFPRLDKESPVSSTHEAAVTAPTSIAAPSSLSVKIETATVMSPGARSVNTGFFEDAESVEILGEDSDDDGEGFNTDEEYDILDASDEEFA